jgi:RHS repeat-associated protein
MQQRGRGGFEYTSFGMTMQGRSFSVAGKYRYGFNGKEKDNDLAADNYDFGARIYDARIGRWMAVDPDAFKGPSWSVYNSNFNNPILFVDNNGKWPIPIVTGLIGAAGGMIWGAIKGDDWKTVLTKGGAGFVAGFAVGLMPAAICSIVTGESLMAASVSTFTSIVGTQGTIVTGMVGGVFGSGIENVIEQGVDVLRGKKKKVDHKEVTVNMAAGMIEGILGLAGDMVGDGAGEYVKKSLKASLTGISKEQEKVVKKGIKKLIKAEAEKNNVKLTKKELEDGVNSSFNLLKRTKTDNIKLTISNKGNAATVVTGVSVEILSNDPIKDKTKETIK